MNILFWNLNANEKKDNIEINGDYICVEDLIVNCLLDYHIDIAIFSEFKEIDFDKILKKLEKIYKRAYEPLENKVTLIAKSTAYEITTLRQNSRYSIYRIKGVMKIYILSAIHLEDRRNNHEDVRKNTIRGLVSYIEEAEVDNGCYNSIVIGDFNANPFDNELLSKYEFNSVLFKEVIKNCKYVKVDDKEKRLFYNPILNYISEDTCMYGSYYYVNSGPTPYWHCLDQVLVREELSDNLFSVEYLKKIGDIELLTIYKHPNKKISDHLPILVKLDDYK